jgi:hypothetical protein
MTDPTSTQPDATHATPRWVRRFWAIGALLVLLLIVLLVAGGHGPGRHQRAGHERSPASISIGQAGGPQT